MNVEESLLAQFSLDFFELRERKQTEENDMGADTHFLVRLSLLWLRNPPWQRMEWNQTSFSYRFNQSNLAAFTWPSSSPFSHFPIDFLQNIENGRVKLKSAIKMSSIA